MASATTTTRRVRRGRGFRRRTAAASTATMFLSASNAWDEDESDQHNRQLNKLSIQMGQTHFHCLLIHPNFSPHHRYEVAASPKLEFTAPRIRGYAPRWRDSLPEAATGIAQDENGFIRKRRQKTRRIPAFARNLEQTIGQSNSHVNSRCTAVSMRHMADF
jgi:hypothetical protein